VGRSVESVIVSRGQINDDLVQLILRIFPDV
jgi:hypothetical protein